MKPLTSILAPALLTASLALLPACEDKPAAPAPAPTPTPADSHSHDGHDHADGDHSHDHADHADHDHGHGHGEAVSLGDQTISGYNVAATRHGDIAAGKEAAIDLAITPPGNTSTSTIAAVRVWIGTEDARGSIKAKADAEGAASTIWHAHIETPTPLPDGARLWVEIEIQSGEKSTASFDLKV